MTTDLVYVRLHGHTRKYASSYSRANLSRWADKLRLWAGEGRDVHVYFDNDAEGAAITNGVTLSAALGLTPAAGAAPSRRDVAAVPSRPGRPPRAAAAP